MIIEYVENNSIAHQIGLQIADEIESINGHKIRDIIDYRFYVSDEFIKIKINRKGQILLFEVEKEIDEELGLSFAPIKYRCCSNKCIFCFIDQNPSNLRSQLYFKDEDFRLSFLHGNYVTLTNISKSDLYRIVEQRLSPLYISVHAIDSKIRSLMLGLKKDDFLLDKISFLTDHQIELHAQIVLCPEINDGKYLDQTIRELANFYPYLKSIAIVPVGLTKHRKGLYPLQPVTAKYAKQVIEKLEPIADQFKQKYDSYLIYLADEFYLAAHYAIPESLRYEDYYQYENGVGMMRYFTDNFISQSETFPTKINNHKKIMIVTAPLAQPLFEQTVLPKLNSIQGLEVSLSVVQNQFYGASVKVTGLLTGIDIYNELKKQPPSDLILIPANCVNNDVVFLDDWSVNMLENKLNQHVKVLGQDFADLFKPPLTLRVYPLLNKEGI